MNWWYVLILVAVCGLSGDILRRIAELSQRLRAVERKLDAAMKALGVTIEDSATSTGHWKTLARDRSQKIQAIAAYRRETGAGLAEAKQAVEAWIEQGGN